MPRLVNPKAPAGLESSRACRGLSYYNWAYVLTAAKRRLAVAFSISRVHLAGHTLGIRAVLRRRKR